MMKTNFHKIVCAFCVGCAVSSCSEWEDHYENLATSEGSSTMLWQQLKGNPQLSDFCEVLEQTKVFRMHKKTPVSYADMLNSGQSFTVMAPVNNTFNKDSLLQLVQTAQGDSIVEKYFVKNHISRSLTSSKADSTRMRLLNEKRVVVKDGTIGGVTITTPNQRAKNGIVQVMGSPVPYFQNIYEMLCDASEFKAIGTNLRSYEKDEFMPDASVSNGIVDGVPVYVDSVVYERNTLLEYLGELREEDSTYVMVVPEAEGWTKAWDEAVKYFQYDANTQKSDSLRDWWTTRALLEDAIFNMTDQRSMDDSVVSVQYERRYTSLQPRYHIFYKPFEEGGIFANAEKVACTNGTIYKTKEWPFTPEQTFFKVLRSEVEQQSTILTEKDRDCMYYSRSVTADSVSENGYLEIVPKKTTDDWSLTIRVDNNLSGTYDICAIILPKSVANTDDPDMRPCKFMASVNYVDASGKEKEYYCVDDEGWEEFETDPARVDTVVLAKAFAIPTCNYLGNSQHNNKLSITLDCSILPDEQKSYNRRMYLDCIYLRPRTSKSE